MCNHMHLQYSCPRTKEYNNIHQPKSLSVAADETGPLSVHETKRALQVKALNLYESDPQRVGP